MTAVNASHYDPDSRMNLPPPMQTARDSSAEDRSERDASEQRQNIACDRQAPLFGTREDVSDDPVHYILQYAAEASAEESAYDQSREVFGECLREDKEREAGKRCLSRRIIVNCANTIGEVNPSTHKIGLTEPILLHQRDC